MGKVFKVGYCAGHGGSNSTPGKRSPANEYEWNFNDAVVRAMENELKKYEDVELKRFDDRTGKKDVPLQTRVAGANKWEADIYISVHHNANKGTWGTWTGTETFIMPGTQPGSSKLAKLAHPLLVKAMGLRDRGIKTAEFYVLKFTKMPAILTEGGYMDSSIDIKKLRDDKVLKQAGINLAKAVVEYAGLNYTPDLVASHHQRIQVDKSGQRQLVSIFDGSLYGAFSPGRSGGIGFGIDNNLEMKMKSKTDTSEGGYSSQM